MEIPWNESTTPEEDIVIITPAGTRWVLRHLDGVKGSLDKPLTVISQDNYPKEIGGCAVKTNIGYYIFINSGLVS